jgi:calcium-dependent protein kinase
MNYFSERMASRFMRQILSAVTYCHEKNIVHRDLKPENILFNGNDYLKIIDFGTSRKFDPKKKMDKLAGTSYYIAPEVIKEDYDEKCDVSS